MANIHAGQAFVLRFSAPDVASSCAMPPAARYFFMRNDGANDCRFNFDSDAASDYYTLKAGDKTEIITIESGQVLNIDGVGGSTNIELVIWG